MVANLVSELFIRKPIYLGKDIRWNVSFGINILKRLLLIKSSFAAVEKFIDS